MHSAIRTGVDSVVKGDTLNGLLGVTRVPSRKMRVYSILLVGSTPLSFRRPGAKVCTCACKGMQSPKAAVVSKAGTTRRKRIRHDSKSYGVEFADGLLLLDVSVDYGRAAANACGEGGLLQSFQNRRRQGSRGVMRVELGKGKEI